MAEKRRFLDVWIVESNTVYKEVPFTVVIDWVQQGRLLEDDKVKPSGTAEWFRLGGSPDFAPYFPHPEPFRAEDQAEALEPVHLDFAWKRGHAFGTTVLEGTPGGLVHREVAGDGSTRSELTLTRAGTVTYTAKGKTTRARIGTEAARADREGARAPGLPQRVGPPVLDRRPGQGGQGAPPPALRSLGG